jgi:hypothetical protein
MIRFCFFGIICLISSLAFAQHTCADIGGGQSYGALNVDGGVICFIKTRVTDPNAKTSLGVEAITLYYIHDGSAPVAAQGRSLPYHDTPGKIVDAFSSNIGKEHELRVFVIHSMEVRTSLAEPNSSGKFYSVSVFDPQGGVLRRDERASDWFGAGYSWLSDGNDIIYTFPYQTRQDVLRSIDSPLAALMVKDGFIPVRLKIKSYLFEVPNVADKTRKYLVKGDRATVDGVTAGWCRVHYSGGSISLEMWLMCNALSVNGSISEFH